MNLYIPLFTNALSYIDQSPLLVGEGWPQGRGEVGMNLPAAFILAFV